MSEARSWSGADYDRLSTPMEAMGREVLERLPLTGGETLRGVQARVLNELGRIVHDNPRATVAVFTHADPIRLALAHYAGVHIDAYQRLVVHPASVSAVLVGEGMPRILKINDIGGLGDLALPPPKPKRRT